MKEGYRNELMNEGDDFITEGCKNECKNEGYKDELMNEGYMDELMNEGYMDELMKGNI